MGFQITLETDYCTTLNTSDPQSIKSRLVTYMLSKQAVASSEVSLTYFSFPY